ncbi:MAG TPA: hypothetical protein VM577_15375 [Anaerovoracaceae bacterium]|nr:hypothetical protein [Anaerovoracaceae bacterium]
MGNGKIGIFAPEQHGDIALSTCGLKYKDVLWPGKDIVWFCNLAEHKATYLDMLKHNDAISEIRDWPKFDTMEHFRSCVDPNGQLVLSHRADFESMKDLDNGYFPAPWCVLPNNALNAVNYSNIPRMVFGVDPNAEWHPYLGFSNEEREMTKDFCAVLPHAKTIMLETQLRSAGNFNLAEDTIRSLMQLCRNKFGKCNFIFASMMDHTKYVDDPGVVSASQFTVRQTALIHNHCDLFIGVCSGITMAASCWGNKPVPRVELCGSMIVSSIIANGPVNSVICDNFSLAQMKAGLERGVTEALNKF